MDAFDWATNRPSVGIKHKVIMGIGSLVVSVAFPRVMPPSSLSELRSAITSMSSSDSAFCPPASVPEACTRGPGPEDNEALFEIRNIQTI